MSRKWNARRRHNAALSISRALQQLSERDRAMLNSLVIRDADGNELPTYVDVSGLPSLFKWKGIDARILVDSDLVLRLDRGEVSFQMLWPNPKPAPPLNAQFLIDLFLPDDVCEAFLGDLQERYTKKLSRLGKPRADWWYRKQVLTSLWPIFRDSAGRVSSSAVLRVLTFGLRLVGQSKLADAIHRAAEEERKRVS